jgi:hypothetical protein
MVFFSCLTHYRSNHADAPFARCQDINEKELEDREIAREEAARRDALRRKMERLQAARQEAESGHANGADADNEDGDGSGMRHQEQQTSEQYLIIMHLSSPHNTQTTYF